MITPYQESHFSHLVRFVVAIQEYERIAVPELKPGNEIGESYARYLLKMASENSGNIFMAQENDRTVGVICSWLDKDEDQLLKDEARDHAYISDIYVEESHRGRGIAQELLEAVEKVMRQKGCQRIRVCSKATNLQALNLYKGSGYAPYEVIFSKPLVARPKNGERN